MARESRQERQVRLLLAKHDFESRKDGRNGYPDRIVLFGKNAHCWVEHKTAVGRLTRAQKRVFPRLEKRGETIIYARGMTPSEIVQAVLGVYFRALE